MYNITCIADKRVTFSSVSKVFKNFMPCSSFISTISEVNLLHFIMRKYKSTQKLQFNDFFYLVLLNTIAIYIFIQMSWIKGTIIYEAFLPNRYV